MIECLQLRGYSLRTQECYVQAVRQLANHYQKSPDLITDQELRGYFLHIKNVKKYSRAASTIALCGIKFFFEKTLGKQFTTFELVRAPHQKKLPVILSVEEVLAIPLSNPHPLVLKAHVQHVSGVVDVAHLNVGMPSCNLSPQEYIVERHTRYRGSMSQYARYPTPISRALNPQEARSVRLWPENEIRLEVSSVLQLKQVETILGGGAMNLLSTATFKVQT
jgi:Phage integrase, N-terminal SAM-like domain